MRPWLEVHFQELIDKLFVLPVCVVEHFFVMLCKDALLYIFFVLPLGFRDPSILESPLVVRVARQFIELPFSDLCFQDRWRLADTNHRHVPAMPSDLVLLVHAAVARLPFLEYAIDHFRLHGLLRE